MTGRSGLHLMTWLAFSAWLLLGVAYAVSILGALTIGHYLIGFAVLGTVVLALRPGASRVASGLLCGAGLALCWPAYLNRSGPGTVCGSDASGQFCTEETGPLPWLLVAALLTAVGIALTVVLVRRVPAAAGAPH